MYGIIIAADSGSVVTSALQLFSQFAIIGGGLWAGASSPRRRTEGPERPRHPVGRLAGRRRRLDRRGRGPVLQHRPVDGRPRMVDFIVGILNSIGPASATTSWPTC